MWRTRLEFPNLVRSKFIIGQKNLPVFRKLFAYKKGGNEVRAAIAIGMLLLCFGCAPKKHTLQTPFIENDYLSYGKEGGSIVKGQAFLKTRGGDVKYGAGKWIFLLPKTPYVIECLSARVENRAVANLDDRIVKYTRKVLADGEGRFEFTKVPIGEYVVWTNITWEVFRGHFSDVTGGDVIAIASVTKDDTYNIILTR